VTLPDNTNDSFKQQVPLVVYRRAERGDTILTLVEQENEQRIHELNIEYVIDQFKLINSKLKTTELIVGDIYAIPIFP